MIHLLNNNALWQIKSGGKYFMKNFFYEYVIIVRKKKLFYVYWAYYICFLKHIFKSNGDKFVRSNAT